MSATDDQLIRVSVTPGERLSESLRGLILALLPVAVAVSSALATDWPQYRGPTTDGVSTEPISTNWPAGGPPIVWSNASLTNGFSSFAVSDGRAFTLVSRNNGSGGLSEYCVAVDANTGVNLWATPVGDAPWDPVAIGNGGDGTYPYNTGDGPRSTPSVQYGRVFVLSGLMALVCLDAASGSVVWSNNLKASFGAREVGSGWNNAASPRFDNDLIFVNLSTATNKNLSAFRTSDGSRAWGTSTETLTHTTPIVASILGTRQVLFATVTGVVGVDRDTGSNLWKFPYPWGQIYTSMGASPVVYSNIVFCTAGYNKGAAAFSVSLVDGIWYASTPLWYLTYPATTYQSIWMTPVVHQGYIYGQFGYGGYITGPLICLELATGRLMWSVPNFGKGGTILVNQLLLSLTEDGQVVLVQPDPAQYRELARARVFQFGPENQGKCWNSPAYSNGRIYARSTRGGAALDVSLHSPLKFFPPQILVGGQLEIFVGTVDGSPISADRLARIALHASDHLDGLPDNWPIITGSLVLTSDGRLRFTNALDAAQSQRFYTVVETP
ncbi:MAG TPA: PQQ-binding-like beta-propeller repeat protein [Verrucomicrobiae bacterium]